MSPSSYKTFVFKCKGPLLISTRICLYKRHHSRAALIARLRCFCFWGRQMHCDATYTRCSWIDSRRVCFGMTRGVKNPPPKSVFCLIFIQFIHYVSHSFNPPRLLQPIISNAWQGRAAAAHFDFTFWPPKFVVDSRVVCLEIAISIIFCPSATSSSQPQSSGRA